MYCTKCGEQIENKESICPYCGYIFSERTEFFLKKDAISHNGDLERNHAVYHLPVTSNRFCDIKVFSDHVTFSGTYWYLRDKDFYKKRVNTEALFIKDFMGMGYLTKRSYRRTVIFVFVGLLLEIVKSIVDQLSEWVDKANSYLKWINYTIALPEWTNMSVNVMAFLCIVFGIALFFSKKKVIEISFTNKRICIPQKSLSEDEFQKLYNTIKSLKE